MHLGRPAVLLVDDDSDSRSDIASWLGNAGYRCITVEEGPTALWYARQFSPQAALVEIGQRRERRRLVDTICGEFPLTAVITMSSAHEARRLPAPADGVCGHLTTPSDAAQVVAAVRGGEAVRQDRGSALLRQRAEVERTITRRQQRLGDAIANAISAEAAHAALQRSFAGRLPPLFAHARRVARIAARLTEALLLPADVAGPVIGAALLHDIGKLTLPEPVLQGEEPLGDIEIDVLGNHHERTLDLLSRGRGLGHVARILEHSQARWDGTGVPWRLSGQNIPIGARIVAIADAADAARRTDRGETAIDARYDALAAGAGTRLDPDLVRVCLHALDAGEVIRATSSPQAQGVKCW